MPQFDIRFVSGNRFKLDEAAAILSGAEVRVVPIDIKLDELQTDDTPKLIKDRTLKAFTRVGRPLFVEHTGLGAPRSDASLRPRRPDPVPDFDFDQSLPHDFDP